MVRCVTELGSDSCSDCGWVDYVQSPMPSDWNSISYVYDPSGRRIEKKYDGQAVMKYLYDGDHIIAEYDATGALVHKYIYGPGVDQPICMIDVSDANATYYYHLDGLGSVIALTDSSGSVANLYEYNIFGEVSASDPNHPNRFLFTGREFDTETGLYYYRARYYNPYIGRFLQTDPIGDGMNRYAYCRNNAINAVDPLGLRRKLYGDFVSDVKARSVRNADPEGDHYFPQYDGYDCAPLALANLYIASGDNALEHVYKKMRDTYCEKYSLFVPEATGPARANHLDQYFRDYLEVKTGVTTWEDNIPFNQDGSMDKRWGLDGSGIDSLDPLDDIINEVGGIGTYYFDNDITNDYRKIEDAVRGVNGAEGKPAIVAFRMADATQSSGVIRHAVVVRYWEGAESYDENRKEWVSTPYEVIDGLLGYNQPLYFTPTQFMQLVEQTGAQAVLPR